MQAAVSKDEKVVIEKTGVDAVAKAAPQVKILNIVLSYRKKDDTICCLVYVRLPNNETTYYVVDMTADGKVVSTVDMNA